MKSILLSFFLCSFVFAETAYDVAKKISAANEGFKGEVGEMEMELVSGDLSIIRKMKSMNKEGQAEDKSLLEFLLPKDVAGTKLLTWSYDDKDDQQWIYLPALKRVKRITSSGKTASFMGSEFTFEDLRKPALDKYEYSNLKSTNEAWTFTKKSKEKSGYSKQEVRVSKKYTAATEIKFFDRSGELLKVATYENFKSFKVGNKDFWKPSKVVMKNVQTEKKSIITWRNRKIGASLSESEFNKRALK